MKRKKSEEGMALLVALIAIFVVLGAVTLVAMSQQKDKKSSDSVNYLVMAEEAAKAGIDMSIDQIWREYTVNTPPTEQNWATFRDYLNDALEMPINEDLNLNGEMDPGEADANGNGTFEVNHEPWTFMEGELEINDPTKGVMLAKLKEVRISRLDTLSQATLTIHSTAEAGNVTKTAVQVLEIGGENLFFPDFSVITNNISCILCHAEFRNLNEELNTDPEVADQFSRIKVASLESMIVRDNAADSNVAGTLYTRGQVYKQNGSLFNENTFANADFKSYLFDTGNGNLVKDNSDLLQENSFGNAGVDGNGDLEKYSNLYMDYPTDIDAQTDGRVPDSFPSPFPDVDGDRNVDPEEFVAVVNSISDAGSISGGVQYGVPDGDVYGDNALPTASNGQTFSEGVYEGNMILVGTPQDPIKINGDVAIEGDLVIAGPIEGKGRFLVKNNTYVVGDVYYTDGGTDPHDANFGHTPKVTLANEDPGTFAFENAGGDENNIALVAGGNVLMGDYTSVRGVNDNTQDNRKYPNWSQASINVRTRNKSMTKNGELLEYGYFDPYSVDDNGQRFREDVENGDFPSGPGYQFSFTMSELQLYNKREAERAIDDPDYVPRFYGLREGQTDPVTGEPLLWVWDKPGDEHSVRYSETNGVELLSDFLQDRGALDVLDRGATLYLSPQGGWLPEDALREMWYADEMGRAQGDFFRFDGLVYTNNAIFSIVRSNWRHKSNTNGKMLINGSLIASDLGVFSPGGFMLRYDERVKDLLYVPDLTVVTLRRTAFFFDQTPDV